MNKKQFNKAFNIARNIDIDLSNDSIDIFDGFGLQDFKPVVCTIRQIARLMRWQGLCFNGAWNMEEVNEIFCFKNKFIVMDDE